MAFHIKKVVEKQHPNIHKLVNVIKKEAVITQMKMATFESGATFPLGRKNKEKEKGIQTLLERFKKGNFSLNHYLEAMKHLTGL